MRAGLRLYVGRRIRFIGKVKAYSVIGGANQVLVTNIFNPDTGEYLTDHSWVHRNMALEGLNAKPGDVISGTALVTHYIRVSNAELDYGLARLNDLCVEKCHPEYPGWERAIQRAKQKAALTKTKATKPPKPKINGRNRRYVDMTVYCEDGG